MELHSITLPEGFLDEEIRCGYKVTSKQKKIWAIQLDLLKKLLMVCDKHNIVIHATGGTLLGAIRHKGYIPWDDDIDIQITRSNFEKLLAVSDEFEYPYFLQTARSDRCYYIEYARLRNSETTGIIKNLDDENYNNGIFIDLSVYDACPIADKEIKKQLRKCRITGRFCRLYNDNSRNRSGIKKVIRHILKYTLFKLYDYNYFINKNEEAMKMYEGKTPYVSAMFVKNLEKIKKLRCREEDLHNQIYVDFENIKIPIWETYSEYLTDMYGDYMSYPPEGERGKWHDGIIIFDPDIPYKEFYKSQRTKLVI